MAQGVGLCAQDPGHEDYYFNNTVFMTGNDVGGFTCDGPGKTVVYNNRYFTPNGAIEECGYNLTEWQNKSEDVGSTVAKIPADDVIISLAKAVLYGYTPAPTPAPTPNPITGGIDWPMIGGVALLLFAMAGFMNWNTKAAQTTGDVKADGNGNYERLPEHHS